MSDPSPRLLRCVFDTSVVINFIHIDRLDLLSSTNEISGHYPEEAKAEVSRPDQKSSIELAISARILEIVRIDTPEELSLSGTLRERYGMGESAALALARVRGMHLGCDERRSFMTTALQHLGRGRYLNTPTVLLRAIRLGAISVGEADTYKLILEGHRFKMPFSSFRDVLGHL